MPHVQTTHTFSKEITIPVTRHYLLYLPKDYQQEKSKRWPLVLFLHGMGERGEDLNLVTRHGPPKLVEAGHEFPFLLVSPQCPPNGWWAWDTNIHALAALLDELEHSYAVDPDRIYVTGISMGGYGTWALANAYPDRFAAIAPICGGGNPSTICAIRHMPVWTFHGDQDHAVPLRETTEIVDALRACGGNVKLTVYDGVGHDSWTQTYDNPELYMWLLEQRKSAVPDEHH
jgi:predicted peptidase